MRGATRLVTKVTRASLDRTIQWIDLLGIALLAGIGFSVSLLISELSIAAGSGETEHAEVAILSASALAAALATVVLRARNRHYRKIDTAGDNSPG